jgi:sentrin-specific protease 7
LRNDDPETSAVHYFTPDFFTTLDKKGPVAVSSWFAKKNVDIFKKRFVFIPTVDSLQWSLCVVINPGAISNEYAEEEDQSDDQDFPCILFLESVTTHRKARIANKVRNWLNHEAKRLGKFTQLFEANNPKPFNKDTMEVFDPRGEYVQ